FADQTIATPTFSPPDLTLHATAGDDVLAGGLGDDTASYDASGSAVIVNLTLQGAPQNTYGPGFDTLTSIENLTGTSLNDALTGDGGANILRGGDGHDQLRGGGGDDVLYAGTGSDWVDGGSGYDIAVLDQASAVHLDLALTTPQDTGEGFDQ